MSSLITASSKKLNKIIAINGDGYKVVQTSPIMGKVIDDAGFESAEMLLAAILVKGYWEDADTTVEKGGTGSGHHDHAGRPGKVGGSQPGKGVAVAKLPKKVDTFYSPGTAPDVSAHSIHMRDENAKQFLNYDLVSIFEAEGGTSTTGIIYYDCAGPVIRGRLKDEIVKDIARESGLSYETVNDLIANWAATSNDNDLRALLLQQDIADELGLELSQWQLGHIKGMIFEKHEQLRLGLNSSPRFNELYTSLDDIEKLSDVDFQSLIDSKVKQYMELNNQLASVQDVKGFETLHQAELAVLTRSVGVGSAPRKYLRLYPAETQKAFARAMYDITQKELLRDIPESAEGTIKLFRGFDATELIFPEGTDFMITDYVGNAVESWAADYETAYRFGGTIVTMDVPLTNIIGSCKTGFGCLTEGEFVIAGNIPDQQVVIVKTPRE